ncbi:MAG: hypothetical protein ABW169_11495, partial [Sphingobium sp.]
MADRAKKPIALQFRRKLTLAKKIDSLVVHVSADNRYVLYVNGRRIAAGPSRGDLGHWRYARIDLAPFLRAGDNVIAAEVWNDGDFAARAQVSARTGFYFKAERAQDAQIDVGPSWQVRVDDSRTLTSGMSQVSEEVGGTYYVAGAPETHEGARKLADWASAHSAASDWVAPVDAAQGSTAPWALMPDPLPQMRHDPAAGGKVVRATGIVTRDFPKKPLMVPADSEISLVVDAGAVEAAYPELVMDGGAGATVSITYTESPYRADKTRQVDRGVMNDGKVLGLRDTYHADGKAGQLFSPFWWRTWRFAEIRVKTANAPLRLRGFRRQLTGYPFAQKAWFTSSDPELNRIWQIGWNTLLVDAHETFMDTSYWEQMQYIGDSRIEAMVADLVSGDPRLSEQAIRAFDGSRSVTAFARESFIGKPLPELRGLPQAAWPSAEFQSIPPFALLWVGMIDDYRMRRPADRLVREMLPGVRHVVDWFTQRVTKDGLVGKLPAWTFLDWRPNLEGKPDWSDNGDDNACVVTLSYLGALREAANMEEALGDPARAQANRAAAVAASSAIRRNCWSQARGLYADNAAKTRFSQHANLLAVLYDVTAKDERQPVMNRILAPGKGISAPEGITGVSYYFAFYLSRALDYAGMGDRYIETLS